MRITKETLARIVTTLLCACMMLSMLACFGPKTIEEAFSMPEVQEEMQRLCDEFESENSDFIKSMEFEIEGNSIIFRAHCLQNFEELNPAQVTYLDDMFVSMMKTEAADLRETLDIEGEIRIGVYMYNADGSEYYSKDMNFY